MSSTSENGNGPTETLSAVLPTSTEEAAAALLEICCDADLKIATAESCTGRLLASLLTDVEGASHAFERGFVVYSEEAKCELLGIARAQIEACGAVSREVAIAMAQGAVAKSHADVALTVTGYAGSAPRSKEPGLVHFAMCPPRGCGRTSGSAFRRYRTRPDPPRRPCDRSRHDDGGGPCALIVFQLWKRMAQSVTPAASVADTLG